MRIPKMILTIARRKLYGWKRACALALVCAAVAITASGQTFQTLVSFDVWNGYSPASSLIQGLDGNLYGTTDWGGAYYAGTIFKITPEGALKSLHSFCAPYRCADGAYFATLVQATDGNLYGTALSGGAYYYGTVFKITSSGTLTPLHAFNSSDGAYPSTPLVQATDGNFYGTTAKGGDLTCNAPDGCGTIFKITPQGTLRTLHRFHSDPLAPQGPFPSGLIQGTDGNFYGTTLEGGALGTSGQGTVFKMTPSGVLTTLYTFCAQGYPCLDGVGTGQVLVQGTDGNFYGTTFQGGTSNTGTAFKITPEGVLTTLHSFSGTDGTGPTWLI